MDITCRPAKPEDLEEAERVVQQSGNALLVRHGLQPWPAPPSTAFPKFCLAQDPSGLWVAEDGDTIVGFGFSWMSEKFWCLSQLFVRPEAQAKGIGQALLAKTLMQAERNGAANRALITFASNIASTGLYLKNGLYPREPLYEMAAPAQAVAQNLADAGYDITSIAPWPDAGEWIGRIDQELLGFRRDLHHQFLLGGFAGARSGSSTPAEPSVMPTSPPGVMSVHWQSHRMPMQRRSRQRRCAVRWRAAQRESRCSFRDGIVASISWETCGSIPLEPPASPFPEGAPLPRRPHSAPLILATFKLSYPMANCRAALPPIMRAISGSGTLAQRRRASASQALVAS